MSLQKKILIICILLLSSTGILYWIFRVDINDYFISRNAIYWSENVEIELSDFKATINPDSEADMFYYHAFYLKAKDGNAYCRSFFDKSKSWAKDTLGYNFKLENELQKIRFDLFEAYSRKFNRRIEQLGKRESTEYKDLTMVGDSLYSEIKVHVDSIFDSNLTTQERINLWRPKINLMLEKYK